MEWKSISEGLPPGAALIFAGGEYHVAVVVDGERGPAFMGVHSWALLPWPSHWMELPPPPSAEPSPD